MKTLDDVSAFLETQIKHTKESRAADAKFASAVKVCRRSSKERAELLKATQRLSTRLTACTQALAKQAERLK